jgi:peptidyl-prolyl cis-trans isomerase C
MERWGSLVYDQCNIRWRCVDDWSAQYGEALAGGGSLRPLLLGSYNALSFRAVSLDVPSASLVASATVSRVNPVCLCRGGTVMRFGRACFCLLACLFLLTQPGMAQQSTPAKPSDAAQDVLAIVNGQRITRLDFEQLVQQYKPDTPDWAERNKSQVLRDLITLEILSQEGSKLRLEQEPEIQSQLRLRSKDVLARALVQKYIAERSNVTEEAVRQHYETAKDDYKVSEQITASHILVRTEGEAQAALKELKQGKDFAVVAEARSIDSSAADGGSLGTFGRGEMIPAFEEAAFALKVGEVSNPVRTEFGYHVIKVTNRIAAHARALEEVQDDIRETLIERSVDAFIDDLRHHAKVEILHPEYGVDASPPEKRKEK